MADALCYAPVPRPSPAAAPHRRRIIAQVVGVGLLLAAAGIAYFVLGVGRRGSAVESAGSAQVIARGEEAWLFLDVDRNVRGRGVVAGPPVGRVVRQVAVVFDERGVKTTIDVVMGSRWSSFHPNLGTIFGLEDGPYLLRGPSELMRWQGDRFQPVPDWDRQNLPAVPELAATPDYQEEPVLDRASGRHGWTPVARVSSWYGSPMVAFSWKGRVFILEEDASTVPARVLLRRMDDGHEWSAPVATYDAVPRAAHAGE